jgi:serine/threonine-protein kinase
MSSDTLQAGQVIAGRYRVDRQLGEGGMGSVYLVQHVHTDEQLALKVLHSAVVKDEVALERFQREARTPARIQSDHVVRVTDADVAPELGGMPFLVMEYLRGEDLDRLVARRGALPPSEVVLYLRQASRALDKAHAIGIIHRDLKPENLFLTTREDGAPWIKLLDFGIAKLKDASADMTKGRATSTGQIFGTPLFMSPEQALAESAKISAQTDVWALGLIAHKMLTGEDIWTAQTITHLIAQIAYEPMPIPSLRGSKLGAGYDAWFSRCCARAVEDRFPSAGQAVTALARALGLGDGTTTLDESSGVKSGPIDSKVAIAQTAQAQLKQTAGPLTRTDGSLVVPKRRSTVGIIVAGASLVVGVAAGLLLMRGGGAADPVTAPVAATDVAPTASVVAPPTALPTASAATTTATPPAGSGEPVVAPAASTATEPAAKPPVRDPVAKHPVKPPPGPAAPPAKPPAAPPAPTAKPVVDPLAGRQ